ncbi:GNAT family N-acetyltransferase [soil metagenome]
MPATLGQVDGSLVLRDAQLLDVPGITRIFGYYATETMATFETVPLTEPEWLGKLQTAREAGHPFLVATLGSTVIGYAYATAWKSKPGYAQTVENSIYLASGHGGRGYGRALLEELLLRTAESGARQVIAVIADYGSPASLALHRSAGFTEAGRLRQVGFKHGRWIDTVLMQRSLDKVS